MVAHNEIFIIKQSNDTSTSFLPLTPFTYAIMKEIIEKCGLLILRLGRLKMYTAPDTKSCTYL